MASHFSSIGFPVETQDDFLALARQALENGVRFATPRGTYHAWPAGQGVELWLQRSTAQEIIGINPHFAGVSRRAVALTARVRRPDESDLDGGFHAWSNPPTDDFEQGDYPFVFDAPDFAVHDDLDVPLVREVQLAAFAHELRAYTGEAEFKASQAEEPRFGPKSFFPMGLFSDPAEGGAEASPPSAMATFTGEVLQLAKKKNPVSGLAFVWLLVDTFGGEVDVVVDRGVVEGGLRMGGIVRGSFWLSGRVMRE